MYRGAQVEEGIMPKVRVIFYAFNNKVIFISFLATAIQIGPRHPHRPYSSSATAGEDCPGDGTE